MDRHTENFGGRTKVEKSAQRRRNGQNHDRKQKFGQRATSTLIAAVILASISNVAMVAAADIAYCSNINTGGDDTISESWKASVLEYNRR